MTRVKVTFKGFDYHPAGAARQVGPILRRVHSSLTRQINAEAKARVPVLTGHLGRSLAEDPQVMLTPFRVTGGVTAHARYAAAVHEGRGARTIHARNARALHFFWNGREYFVRSVRQGPVRGRPFLRNAGDAVVARDRRIKVR